MDALWVDNSQEDQEEGLKQPELVGCGSGLI